MSYIGAAKSQQMIVWPEPGDINVGVAAGGFFLQSTSFKAAGTLQGLPISASGTLSFRPGPAFAVFADYAFSDYFAVAPQLGYSQIDIRQFQGMLTLPPIGTFATTAPIDGNVGTIIGLVSGIVRPFGTHQRFVPYFGAGIGFASSKASLHSASVLGNTIPIGIVNRETDLALDFLVGADYKVGARGNIGLVYQFNRVNAGELGSGGGLTAKNGPLYGHLIAALFEYHF